MISFQIDQSVIDEIILQDKPSPKLLRRFQEFAISSLKEMGIEDASVDIIRDQKGKVCFGSSRLPLLVSALNRKFVIKEYEIPEYPEEEIDVLKIVNGIISPKVYYFGTNFYAEEWIDHSKLLTLESIADTGPSGLIEAVQIGGKSHAKLARLGVNYAHTHWLDEFHLIKGIPIITDFGDSQKFTKLSDGNFYFNTSLATLRYYGIRNLFKCYPEILVLNITDKRYNETRELILNLSDDPSELFNLVHVIRQAVIGLTRYTNLIPSRMEKGYAKNYPKKLPWNRGSNAALYVFPAFVESFTQNYKLLSENKI